ncbi:MAG: hypothetical protein ACOVT5_06250 [Armatimonadaceae bacterium]
MSAITLRPDTLERMVRAVEAVEERLLRSCRALEAGGVPYAVIGGNAVAAWVAQIDEGGVRNTRDVDILIRREDLPKVIQVMEAVGFVYANVTGVDLFIDGPKGKPSQGVHLLFAGELVRDKDTVPTPTLDEATAGPRFRLVSLEALLRMKLVSYRDKDKTHIRDLIGVGLIDHTWPDRFPPVLAERLRTILADPDG